MTRGQEWFLAIVAIVLLIALLEVKPAWGGMMLATVVFIMLARGMRGGDIIAPN
jgi:surface polysaccharide O-acyltransferase-like enzyme